MQRRWVWAAAFTAAGLVLACGRNTSSSGVGVVDPPQNEPPPAKEEPATGCETVTLRVLGVAQGNVAAAHLVLGDVSAALVASGAALVVAGVPVGATIDLSTDLSAAALGALPFAAATEPVDVTLSFSGGHAVRAAASGALDVCTAPISFRFDPAQVHPERCQVIVKLDVGRSLVVAGGALSFLPQFAVAF